MGKSTENNSTVKKDEKRNIALLLFDYCLNDDKNMLSYSDMIWRALCHKWNHL